jgi:hypothetical protein
VVNLCAIKVHVFNMYASGLMVDNSPSRSGEDLGEVMGGVQCVG